jgi:hypothetical protein
MSMWARLGRFLEIYGPKFLDFCRKTDFGWKSSDYETGLLIPGANLFKLVIPGANLFKPLIPGANLFKLLILVANLS